MPSQTSSSSTLPPIQNPLTSLDPRFDSLSHDPRFVRPSSKKSKPDHSNLGQNDPRFKSLARKSKRTKNTGLNEIQKLASLPKPAAIPEIVDYARGQVLLESSDSDSDGSANHAVGSDLDSDSDSGSELEDSADDEEDVELGPQGPTQKRRPKGPSTSRPSGDLDIDLDEPLSDPDEPDGRGGAGETVEPTRRIAVVNLDWDNVKPLDLFKVFSSLLSPTAPALPSAPPDPGSLAAKKPKHIVARGQVVKVSIYKSQFGKERMSLEDVHGPPREIFKKSAPDGPPASASDDEGSEDSDLLDEDAGGELDEEALRRYQLERLRYYYAIVELDSVSAAMHVYSEIDGTEFERTANIFDLRYVPADMSFDEADLHGECKEDSGNYKGVDFSTDALRHSKVKLTWDAEDPERAKITRLNTQKMTRAELDELDFGAFVAPASSDEEAAAARPAASRDRLRKLLGLADGQAGGENEDVRAADELAITFTPAFADPTPAKPQPALERDAEPRERKAKSAKNRKKRIGDEPLGEDAGDRPSTGAELDLLLHDPSDGLVSHFDLTQIVKIEKLSSAKPAVQKRIRRKMEEAEDVDRFEIDTEDKRFMERVVGDAEFAIDPSNPQFKKTKNMDKLVEASRKKRRSNNAIDNDKMVASKEAKEGFVGDEELQKNSSSHSDSKRIGHLVQSLKSKVGDDGESNNTRKKQKR